MTINLSIESLVDILSIVISTFLALHFLTLWKGNRKANLLLGLFMLQCAIGVFVTQWESFFHDKINPSLFLIPITSPFALMPILYFYATYLTGESKEKRRKRRWILIPLAAEVLLRATFFFSANAMGLDREFYWHYIYWTNYISIPFSLLILVLMIGLIKRHNNNLLNLFSSLEDKKLNWLRALVFIHLFLMESGLLMIAWLP